jgi:hypothetical protein
MCLLTFFPAGVMPDTTALRYGTLVNQDGHGFAIVTDNRIIVKHGMDAESMIETFAQQRDRHPDGPALFHSRLGTHGANHLDNCHPFPVGGDSRTVLAHNGILPQAVQPSKQDPRSDTRIAAEDFLPAFGLLRRRRTRRQLERWMTSYNKMVILTVDRRFDQQAYILNESSGIWDGGIWYSNDGYLPPRYKLTRMYPMWATDISEPTNDGLTDTYSRCANCSALVDDDACAVCRCCPFGRELARHCLCYQSAFLDHDSVDELLRVSCRPAPSTSRR